MRWLNRCWKSGANSWKKKKTHFGSKGQTDIIEDIFNNNRRAHTGHPIKSVMFKMLFADAAIQIS